MSRFISLVSFGLVLVSVLCFASFSYGGGSLNMGSGSGSSGSHRNDKAEGSSTPREQVMLGKVAVLTPIGDDEVAAQAEDGSWVFDFHGRQVLCSEVHDIFTALRIKNVETGSAADWSYRWAKSGGTVIYLASHKRIANVYLQGTTDSEENIKTVLKAVTVVKPKDVKDTKEVSKPRDPKAAK